MSLAWVRTFCLSLPGTTEEIQWGDHLLFKIGGKMFAITSVDDPAAGMTVKADPQEFDELVERPGIIPAPYMARAKWVKLESFDAVTRKELQQLVQRSHDLVRAGLTKKAQAELDKKPAVKKAAAKKKR
ncbi:MAG: MmcQ/YjbR family DNA-binding protein [Acidobacteriota bacterium]